MRTTIYWYRRYRSWRYWRQHTSPGKTLAEQQHFAASNLPAGRAWEP